MMRNGLSLPILVLAATACSPTSTPQQDAAPDTITDEPSPENSCMDRISLDPQRALASTKVLSVFEDSGETVVVLQVGNAIASCRVGLGGRVSSIDFG